MSTRWALRLIVAAGLLATIAYAKWQMDEHARHVLAASFLGTAAETGLDTILFTNPLTGDLCAAAIGTGSISIVYHPQGGEEIGAPATDPLSTICAFLLRNSQDSLFKQLRFLDLRTSCVVGSLSFPADMEVLSESPAWSADGRYVAIACKGRGSQAETLVVLVSAQRHQIVRVLTVPLAPEPRVSGVWWTLGQDVLLALDGRTIAVDTETGTVKRTYDFEVVAYSPTGQVLLWRQGVHSAASNISIPARRLVHWPIPYFSAQWFPGGEFILLYSGISVWGAPFHLEVYEVSTGESADLIAFWNGPPPGGLSLTRSSWIGAAGSK